MRSIKVAKLRQFFTILTILTLTACTTSEAERANNARKTLTALARFTPTVEIASETPSFTITPENTATIDFGTATREITPILNTPTESETTWPTQTPTVLSTEVPTLSPTNTPSSTFTLEASVTPYISQTPTITTTATPITTVAQLQACLNTAGATCELTVPVSLVQSLHIAQSGVRLVCSGDGSLTNSVDNISAVVTISAGTIEDCLIYRTPNTTLSCCADTVSVNNAQDVVLRGNTILWGVDGSLDISLCDDCLIERNIIAESLNNSTHLQGAHSFLSLVRDSRRVRFVHNLLVSAKARMPQLQNCIDCAFLNNVISNYDGVGTLVTLCSEVDYANNYGLRGLDTDDIAYLIRTPNLADLPPGACRPQVFAANNAVDWYRVFNPSDVKAGVYTLSPLTAYYPLEDVWTKEQIVISVGTQNAQADRIRLCVMNADCRILDSPPS